MKGARYSQLQIVANSCFSGIILIILSELAKIRMVIGHVLVLVALE